MQTIYVGNGQWMPVLPPRNREKGLVMQVLICIERDRSRAKKLLGRIYDNQHNNTYLTNIIAKWDQREGPIIQTNNGKKWIWTQHDHVEGVMLYWRRLVDGNNVDRLRIDFDYRGYLLLSNEDIPRANGVGTVSLHDDECVYLQFREYHETMSAHNEYLWQIAENPSYARDLAVPVMKLRAQMTPNELERDDPMFQAARMAIHQHQSLV